MNWYIIFYLFSIADSLKILFGWFAGLSTGFFVLFFIIWLFHRIKDAETREDSEIDEKFKKGKWNYYPHFIFWFKSFMFIMFFSWVFYVVIPNKKQMLMVVVGGAVGEFIVSDTNAQALPADITMFLRTEILNATIEEGSSALLEAMKGETKKKLTDLSKDELIQMIKEKE